MARYIDADGLLQKLPNDLPYKASVKRVLIQAPTADVVEGVRCKDGKHQEQCCEFIMISGNDKNIDFCSYGEKKS